jgi:predicted TIM-barrel fold metal-dependent hydrolase
MRYALHVALLLLPCIACAKGPAAPLVDHHQHLLNPAMAAATPGLKPITAKVLIGMLDAAGIQRAVLLSNAFRYGSPGGAPAPDEYAQVIAENDWTAREAARYPTRLVAFCSFNPLKDYALTELARCARDRRFGRGIKLQFGSSDVDLDDMVDVAMLRRVFRAANANHLAIVVHLRTRKSRPYGAPQALVFLDELLAAAPDVAVQIAHLAGGGGGYSDAAADEVLGVFEGAFSRQDPRVKHLYFDIAGVAGGGNSAERAPIIVRHIRAIGVTRILYGSDGGDPTDPPPKTQLEAFRKLPLGAAEFRAIESNTAPYLR